MVYELYGLTEDEIEVIEDSFKKIKLKILFNVKKI